MRKLNMLGAAGLTACLALAPALGAAPGAAREGSPCVPRQASGATSLAGATGRGLVLTVSTGTPAGECETRGRRLVCRDGARLALADLDGGCLRVESGGQCTLRQAGPADDDPAGADREPAALLPGEAGCRAPRTPVTAESSSIDVECETGSKRGSTYTLDDGDGTGSCGPNRDVDGRVNGGTCTKNGSECGSVDCDHGCGSSSQNCGCRVRSSTKKVAATE